MEGWEDKAWGKVRHVFSTPEVAISYLEVVAGTRSSWHRHADRNNSFHVGRGMIVVECIDQITGAKWQRKLIDHLSFTVEAGILHRFRVIESGHLVEIYWPREAGVAVRLDDIERIDHGGPDDQHPQHAAETMT